MARVTAGVTSSEADFQGGADADFCLVRNLRDEAVSSSRHILDETRTGAVVTQHLAQCADVDPKIGLFNMHVRPGNRHEFALRDDLSSARKKHDENIQGATAEPNLTSILKQDALRRNDRKRSDAKLCPSIEVILATETLHSFAKSLACGLPGSKIPPCRFPNANP